MGVPAGVVVTESWWEWKGILMAGEEGGKYDMERNLLPGTTSASAQSESVSLTGVPQLWDPLSTAKLSME